MPIVQLMVITVMNISNPQPPNQVNLAYAGIWKTYNNNPQAYAQYADVKTICN